MWTIKANLNTARNYMAGFGDISAAVVAGSYTGLLASSEKWNGASWVTSANMSVGRGILPGCGTQIAGLVAGGYTTTQSNVTEKFDGTSFSTTAVMPYATRDHGLTGTQSAAYYSGGISTTLGFSSKTYAFNGTTWTAKADILAVRAKHGMGGTTSVAAIFGGQTGVEDTTSLATTEKYNGTSWSSSGNLNTARRRGGGHGSSDSDCLSYGGKLNGGEVVSAVTESFNGTSWTNRNPLNTAREGLAGCGTTTDALSYCGGDTGLTVTEQYYPAVTVSPLTLGMTTSSPIVVISSLIQPTVLVLAATLLDPGVNIILVQPTAIILTSTLPNTTVNLPNVIYPSAIVLSLNLLAPDVIDKTIIVSVHNFPSGLIPQYKIIDDRSGAILQDWTSVGVMESILDATAAKSVYFAKTSVVSVNFQGTIMWKATSGGITYTASESINLFDSIAYVLQNRLTENRAVNLDKLDATILSRASQVSVDTISAEVASPNGSVVANVGNTELTFKTDLTETITDYWRSPSLIKMKTGSLAGQVRKLASSNSYNGTTKFLTVDDAFTNTPAAGDTFDIINR